MVDLNALPDELLAISFNELVTSLARSLVFVVPTGRDYPRCLLTLMLVCRRWHEIVLWQPSLWAHIDTSWRRAAPLLLARSKDAPLTIIARDGDDLVSREMTWLSADADGFLTNLLTAQPHRIRHYFWIQKIISRLLDPDTPRFMTPLLQYSTPQLRTLDLTYNWCDIDLDEILDFFSRTPFLDTIKLCSDRSVGDREGQIVRPPPSRPPVSMEHLEVFHCIAGNPVTRVLLLLSCLKAPRLRTVAYTIYGRGFPTATSAEVFSRLLPFSVDLVRPLHVKFYEDMTALSITGTDVVGAAGMRRFDVCLSNVHERNETRKDAIVRRGNMFTFLQQTLFDFSSLVSLDCCMTLRTAVWNSFLSSSCRLTTLRTMFSSFASFLPVFLWRARANVAAFLPSLSTVQIDVGYIGGGVLVPGKTWLSMLESEHLNEALEKRQMTGLPKLQSFHIIVYEEVPFDDLEKLFRPADWMEIEPCFAKLRELVLGLTIGGPLHCDNDTDDEAHLY